MQLDAVSPLHEAQSTKQREHTGAEMLVQARVRSWLRSHDGHVEHTVSEVLTQPSVLYVLLPHVLHQAHERSEVGVGAAVSYWAPDTHDWNP